MLIKFLINARVWRGTWGRRKYRSERIGLSDQMCELLHTHRFTVCNADIRSPK